MTLRLGGHEIRVVKDELEVLNMIKSLPHNICGIVLGGMGGQKSLSERFMMFCRSEVATPIYLVGMAAEDLERVHLENGEEQKLNLSVCNSDALLELIKCDECCEGDEKPWTFVL